MYLPGLSEPKGLGAAANRSLLLSENIVVIIGGGGLLGEVPNGFVLRGGARPLLAESDQVDDAAEGESLVSPHWGVHMGLVLPAADPAPLPAQPAAAELPPAAGTPLLPAQPAAAGLPTAAGTPLLPAQPVTAGLADLPADVHAAEVLLLLPAQPVTAAAGLAARPAEFHAPAAGLTLVPQGAADDAAAAQPGLPL